MPKPYWQLEPPPPPVTLVPAGGAAKRGPAAARVSGGGAGGGAGGGWAGRAGLAGTGCHQKGRHQLAPRCPGEHRLDNLVSVEIRKNAKF